MIKYMKENLNGRLEEIDITEVPEQLLKITKREEEKIIVLGLNLSLAWGNKVRRIQYPKQIKGLSYWWNNVYSKTVYVFKKKDLKDIIIRTPGKIKIKRVILKGPDNNYITGTIRLNNVLTSINVIKRITEYYLHFRPGIIMYPYSYLSGEKYIKLEKIEENKYKIDNNSIKEFWEINLSLEN